MKKQYLLVFFLLLGMHFAAQTPVNAFNFDVGVNVVSACLPSVFEVIPSKDLTEGAQMCFTATGFTLVFSTGVFPFI